MTLSGIRNYAGSSSDSSPLSYTQMRIRGVRGLLSIITWMSVVSDNWGVFGVRPPHRAAGLMLLPSFASEGELGGSVREGLQPRGGEVC